MSCSNNLKQIGLGCHTYHDGYGELPPAMLSPFWNTSSANLNRPDQVPPTNRSWGPNWAILILPYIEQDNLYRQMNVTAWSKTTVGPLTWQNFRATVVKTSVCPSDSFAATPFSGRFGSSVGNWARGSYAANAGPASWSATRNGGSNIPGSPGFSAQGRGVMAINWGDGLHRIADGSSNTIMINHIRAGRLATDRRGVWAAGFVGSSVTANYAAGDCHTPNDTGSSSDDVIGCTNDPAIAMGCCGGCASNQANARSQHTGGVLACFGDGSVKFVTNSISRPAWYLLGSGNDGQATPNF